MTWTAFSQAADVFGDVATALALFWLIRIEIRLKRLEVFEQVLSAIITGSDELKGALRDAARWGRL